MVIAILFVTPYLRSGLTSALFLEKIHFFELKNKTTINLAQFFLYIVKDNVTPSKMIPNMSRLKIASARGMASNFYPGSTGCIF